MLKNQIESLLFSSGRKMDLEELSRLTKKKPEDIGVALEDLKNEYNGRNSSTMLVNEGNSWKLTVREQFLSLVQKIVTETELSKTIMETLAVIAFKYPIKQSDLIKIRTNKAYDHLRELDELGYISRQKHGRTNLIKLTQKFFEYFSLPEEKLKEQFQDFSSIAEAIETKEKEIDQIKAEQKARAEEEKNKDEKIKQEVSSLEAGENSDESNDESDEDDQDIGESEVISETKETPKIVKEYEMVGKLEVVDEPSEEEIEADNEKIRKIKEEDQRRKEVKEAEKAKPDFIGTGIPVTKEMEKIIDEKVERIIHPPIELTDEEKEKIEMEKKLKRVHKPKPEDDTGDFIRTTLNKQEKQPDDEPKDLIEASREEQEKKEKEKNKK